MIQSQLETAELTQRDIEILREVDAEQSAEVLEGRAVAIVKLQRRSFVELGMICREIDRRELWKHLVHPASGLPYHSWQDWVTVRLGVSRTKAFAAKKIIEATEGNVSVEDLQEMTRQNLTQFSRLSSEVQRSPGVVEAAKTLTEDGFVEKIQETEPDQHLTKSCRVVLNTDESQRQTLEETIRIAMWVHEVEKREDALDAILSYYLNGDCEREGYQAQTNLQAYMGRPRK